MFCQLPHGSWNPHPCVPFPATTAPKRQPPTPPPGRSPACSSPHSYSLRQIPGRTRNTTSYMTFFFLITVILDASLVKWCLTCACIFTYNQEFYLVKVTTKEDYLSSFWTKLEESQRARIGSSGGSADAPKFWNYGSNSRLFENDTSIFSLGTDEKVGDPTKIYNGEIALHLWALFLLQIHSACIL
jgi:hypothetical protein